MSRVGIRDVAELAGVAPSTVSNFFNHPDRVSPDKAQRIRYAIDTLGFVPSNAGRQLRLGVSQVIGYIAPDVSNPHFAELANSAEQRALEKGVTVFFANSRGSRQREDAYIEVFERHQVQGFLVASHLPIEERLTRARSRGTPSVLIGQRARSFEQPSVSVDDVAGGRLALEHLLRVGCRRIAFVGGPLDTPQVAHRLTGATEIARRSGNATLEVINTSDRSVRGGHEIGEAILSRPPAMRPDGVFTVNDLLALGVLQAVAMGGIDVPRELAIVGYDDIEFAEASVIPLTSINSSPGDFGSAAMDLLFKVIDREHPDKPHRVFDPVLVPRASTLAFAR